MVCFQAPSSGFKASTFACSSLSRLARLSKRRASTVAIAVAGVPGCFSRYSQRAADHFRFGLFASTGLPPDFENCSASFLAWLIIACTRSISVSGVDEFWAFAVRASSNERPTRLQAFSNGRTIGLQRILFLRSARILSGGQLDINSEAHGVLI